MEWIFEADTPAAASRVRKEMVAHLGRSMPEAQDLDDAEVIIGELLSNAILHGRGSVRAIICGHDGEPFVTVCDNGPSFSLRRPPDLCNCNEELNEHGRGMYIISSLGRDAKVHQLDGRKAVTVQLALR